MSTDLLISMLNTLRKEYSHVPVKVEIFAEGNHQITRITLKESTDCSSDLPSGHSSKNPREKKKNKKNPSRIRRDAKRREAFLGKKTESAVSVPTPEKDKASSLDSTPAPASPRPHASATTKGSRVVVSSRTGDGDREGSMMGTGAGYSPIPQLDGGDFSVSDDVG